MRIYRILNIKNTVKSSTGPKDVGEDIAWLATAIGKIAARFGRRI